MKSQDKGGEQKLMRMTPRQQDNNDPKKQEAVLKEGQQISLSGKNTPEKATSDVGRRSKRGSPVVDKAGCSTNEAEDDEEQNELAKLRCGSLCTEEVVEREKQKQERRNGRQNRCADYPGLAFGSAMFGSDTMMKFNIIKNELHNIMRSQLKRVDGEVNALSSRVRQLDENLEESERYIRTATTALAEAVQLQIEESSSAEETNTFSAFDQHVSFLEAQLREARIRASQSFQILEDCDEAQERIEQKLSLRPVAGRAAAAASAASSGRDDSSSSDVPAPSLDNVSAPPGCDNNNSSACVAKSVDSKADSENGNQKSIEANG